MCPCSLCLLFIFVCVLVHSLFSFRIFVCFCSLAHSFIQQLALCFAWRTWGVTYRSLKLEHVIFSSLPSTSHPFQNCYTYCYSALRRWTSLDHEECSFQKYMSVYRNDLISILCMFSSHHPTNNLLGRWTLTRSMRRGWQGYRSCLVMLS